MIEVLARRGVPTELERKAVEAAVARMTNPGGTGV